MDYMCQYLEEMDFIFRNFTVVFKHVFKALYFLETHGIIHRDVKCKCVIVCCNYSSVVIKLPVYFYSFQYFGTTKLFMYKASTMQMPW